MNAASEMLKFCQSIPDSLRDPAAWAISFDDFDRLLRRMKDSAPGPDGIPYSAWAHSSSEVRKWLFEAYLRWIQGSALPEKFNHSYLVFLPKGEEDNDAIGISRTPANTRPLNLGNTCAKLFAATIHDSCPPSSPTQSTLNSEAFAKAG